MKNLIELIEIGEPLVQQAVEALRRYNEARSADAPAKEVERLRIEAESLFHAVSEYQLSALGGPAATRH